MSEISSMMHNISFDQLKTEKIWQYFLEITQVPRPTFHEEKIKTYLLNWAQIHNFSSSMDEADNIVIKVPASPGYETKPSVVLQAHKDMVCEKNEGIDFDFLTQGLQLEIVDGWLKAKGTTLGADNGIGIAAAMAIATDNSAKHPEIEILITASEERGLIGANNLSNKLLSADTLINLDTESWGDVYVGCAGSQSGEIILNLEKQAQQNKASFQIKVHSLKGGHSGLDIDKPRINAARFLSLALSNLQKNISFSLNTIHAGNLPNAIPRESSAIISCDHKDTEQLIATLQAYYQQWYKIYQDHEPHFTCDIEPCAEQTTCYCNELSTKILNFGTLIHAGVLAMSSAMANLVESSNNLSSMKEKDKQMVITIYTRSDNNLGVTTFMQGIEHLCQLNDAILRKSPISPGWKPDMNSRVLKIAQQSYQTLYAQPATIKAIHAGLECGAILDKYPHMDMVSIGPSITGAHSPDEKVKIDTVSEFYQLLKHMLASL